MKTCAKTFLILCHGVYPNWLKAKDITLNISTSDII